MTDKKEFPSSTLLTLYSGRACGCTFSEMHEAMEFVLGEPVWTHSMGKPWPWEKARAALEAVIPDLRIACADIPATDEGESVFNEWLSDALDILESTYTIERGEGRSPGEAQAAAFVELESMGNPVIVVGRDGGAS